MAFMVKSGLYYLSRVYIHNGVVNLVASDLKPQVVKLNDEVVTEHSLFHGLMAQLRMVPLAAEKLQVGMIDITEITEEQCRALIAQ